MRRAGEGESKRGRTSPSPNRKTAREEEDPKKSNGGGNAAKILKPLPIDLKLLECPVCFEMILPPIILCSGGHSVCSNCMEKLNTCPSCRGYFTRVRNRFAEDLLDKYIVKCKYRESGCQVEITGRELAEHQKICNYRPLSCPGCRKEVPYQKLLDHLKNQDKIGAKMGAECNTGYAINADAFQDFQATWWHPTWIKVNDKDFFCCFGIINFHGCIWISGYLTPEECSKYTCSITISNVADKTELSYIGMVHPVRATLGDVFNSGHCLYFMNANLKNLITNNRGGITVLVKIGTKFVRTSSFGATVV